eukprot:NODE_85_length_22232_cov_1.318619.p24 type:complete len:106 gc:universal NODE_85_length_22232_cov_1.318619:20624-20307(-)
MFVALLVVAFPITILSINMAEVYDRYRTEKLVEIKEKSLDEYKATSKTKLTDEQSLILKEMSQDLIKALENLSKLKDSTKSVLEQNANLRASVNALLGEYQLARS